MKKLLAILLIFSLLLTLAACGEKPQENNDGQVNIEANGQPENNGQETNEPETPPTNKEPNNSSNTDNTPTDNKEPVKQEEENSNETSGNGDNNGDNNSTPSEPDTQEDPQKPVIDLSGVGSVICFGDSITEGMSVGSDYCYPSILQKNLGNQITVFNGGVSGETSATIMSRANAVEFTVTDDVTFAAGQKKVELSAKLFTTTSGEEIYYRYGKLGNGLSATKVKIDGKAYTLSVEHGATEAEHKYIIERSDAAKALTLKKGVKVEFDYSEYFEKRYCTIVLMGANDDDLTAEQLIARYKEIAKTSKYFIAIIPHYGTDYSAEFEKAFPNATVNLREYCKNDVWQDYGFTKTAKDEYFMSTGNVAAQFVLNSKKGDCHLSEKGYKVLGDLIYKKGVEMGIWN